MRLQTGTKIVEFEFDQMTHDRIRVNSDGMSFSLLAPPEIALDIAQVKAWAAGVPGRYFEASRRVTEWVKAQVQLI